MEIVSKGTTKSRGAHYQNRTADEVGRDVGGNELISSKNICKNPP
jgi:hypothetical protein